MKVVGLVSGGKDSCYAMMKCLQYGHEIVALANLLPADDAEDELDSYMYQTVGHQIVISYAKCMGVPLFRRRIQGLTRNHGLSYSMTPGDEVEDMFILLNEVKRQIPSVSAVSSGAIASDYQRLRVESVCSRLGLVSLAYLWKQDQSLLLEEMIRSGIAAITVKVAAIGLDPSKHLGKAVANLQSYLHKLKELYGINVCGEGGEYETLTLDCPLFANARIVLDKFQIIMHSSDPIAPVGILHPLSFHLEEKLEMPSSSGIVRRNGIDVGESNSVHEVLGDCQQICELANQSNVVSLNLAEVTDCDLHISKTKKDDTFSISCWLQDSCRASADLQEDLKLVLTKIESQLMQYGYSWEHVIYVHLYIDNMSEFVGANETYVRFITQDKCRFGVPSRSTIELPLGQVGLGRGYIEVLVANDHTKRVLHVQSISCWAPSCIGPYSQATLHRNILYMAGQLGLHPPTMLLCGGGASAELEQALENSEAVAKCFNCSISTSAVVFVIYCSSSMDESERVAVKQKMDTLLLQMKLLLLNNRSISEVLDPIFLYVLVPDLPKSALVEVKPVLYVMEDVEFQPDQTLEDLSVAPSYWDFQHRHWHDTCLQKCIVHGKVCAIILSVTDELATNICMESVSTGAEDENCKQLTKEQQLNRLSQFCIYRLDTVLMQNNFTWDEITSLRFYFSSRLEIPHRTVSSIFTSVFDEFAQLSKRIKINEEPIFNLVPVLGAGRSASSMDDILTCELHCLKL